MCENPAGPFGVTARNGLRAVGSSGELGPAVRLPCARQPPAVTPHRRDLPIPSKELLGHLERLPARATGSALARAQLQLKPWHAGPTNAGSGAAVRARNRTFQAFLGRRHAREHTAPGFVSRPSRSPAASTTRTRGDTFGVIEGESGAELAATVDRPRDFDGPVSGPAPELESQSTASHSSTVRLAPGGCGPDTCSESPSDAATYG